MKRKWLLRTLGLFLVGGMCWLLVGVTINFPPKSPRQKLDDARTLWQAKGIKDYQMDISFGSFSFISWYRIVVHNDQPVDIMWLPFSSTEVNPAHSNLVDEKLPSPETNPNLFAKAMSPNLRDYTVDGLFDIAAPKVEGQPPSLVTWCNTGVPYPKISFNPEYGYIQDYDLGSCAKWEIGGGMLCPILADCNTSMMVRKFESLPPS